MASYGQMPSQAPPRQAPRGAYAAPAAVPASTAPAGTFAPGTKIQVGGHRVLIQKYLSEGGFAHVYLVKLPKPVDGTDMAVLKRVAVPDKDSLRSMRTEVETMKRLKGHRPIVTYIDSHASEMRGGGYEVFLLMEYCNGGGLIDFMNTRLQHRLTEPEIINIFSDIAEGVACMHYLKPALLHRDLKVENVLITSRGSSKRFKLCDFGSSAPPRPAPTTVVECRLMDEDIQKHTTLQYRSPEMVDVYRKQPMNEKADIWALGVLLYKLCYYTTPFEDQGQLAILNASYKYPSHPVFSDRLKKLIASMLKESIQARPNIYQVLEEACAMQGREAPIHNIYAGKSQSEARSNGRPASTVEKPQSKPVVGAVFSPPPQETQSIPDVVPMRRGRPAASPAPSRSPRPDGSASKVTGGDPFAALDSKPAASGGGDDDDISSRFPSLSQFSLLHDQGGGFNFDHSVPTSPPKQQNELKQRLTERLADAAFAPAQASPPNPSPVPRPQSVTPTVSLPSASPAHSDGPAYKLPSASPKTMVSRAQSTRSSKPDPKPASSVPTSKYVSTGTWTGDLSPERLTKQWSASNPPQSANLPRTSSLSRQVVNDTAGRPREDNTTAMNPRGSSVQSQPPSTHIRQPSIEASRSRPDMLDQSTRSVNLASRPRPVSTNLEASSWDALREKEASRAQSRFIQPSPRGSPRAPSPNLDPNGRLNDGKMRRNDADLPPTVGGSGFNADSEDGSRSGTPSASGPKNILATKFGDAFKRFESNDLAENSPDTTSSDPVQDSGKAPLDPLASSGATNTAGRTRSVDDEMTPEMRRDMERQQLEEEEQRVEAAQAEYKKRVAEGGSKAKPTPGSKGAAGASRAGSIQTRVQNLLTEEPPSVQRTAQGYGKYTDSATTATKPDRPSPTISRKPLAVAKPRTESLAQAKGPAAMGSSNTTGTSSAPPTMSSKPTGKPVAPKKPVHLNSFPTGARRPPSPQKESRQPQAERLMAVDLPGQPVIEMSAREKDDYIEDFSKRFPSLGALETESSGGRGPGGGSRR